MRGFRHPTFSLLVGLTLATPAIAQSAANAPQRHMDDPRVLSMERFMAFVNDTAAMAGATASCQPQEEVNILICSSLIMDNWNRLTGLPSVDTPAFRKATRIAWSKEEFRAKSIADVSPQSCPGVIAAEARSPIWKVCSHPGSAAGETGSLKLQ